MPARSFLWDGRDLGMTVKAYEMRERKGKKSRIRSCCFVIYCLARCWWTGRDGRGRVAIALFEGFFAATAITAALFALQALLSALFFEG